jgi:hypothetical protein
MCWTVQKIEVDLRICGEAAGVGGAQVRDGDAFEHLRQEDGSRSQPMKSQ